MADFFGGGAGGPPGGPPAPSGPGRGTPLIWHSFNQSQNSFIITQLMYG